MVVPSLNIWYKLSLNLDLSKLIFLKKTYVLHGPMFWKVRILQISKCLMNTKTWMMVINYMYFMALLFIFQTNKKHNIYLKYLVMF